MSDPGIPPGSRSTPSAFPGPPAPGVASPATVMPDAVLYPEGMRPQEPVVEVRYARTAVTPIPMMVGAVVALGAAAWAYDWSALAPGADDPVGSSEWWANITAVLLPGEDLRLASYSQFRMWLALSFLVLAALVVALWIGRIGRNLRPSHAPFGSLLPLLAFPAWWMLPLTLGTTNNFDRSRADLLVRYLVAFGLLFTQFLILRWPLLNRIWRAGRLRYDVASVVLWLPMMIPWAMILLSSAFTYLAIGNDGVIADSAWVTTPAMFDWARNLTRATSVGVLVLLVVVTVAQHLGIAEDRADEQARRAAVEANQPPA